MGKRANGATGARCDGLKELKVSLEQLSDEAAASGMTIAATLIGAAAEDIGDEFFQRQSRTSLSLDEAPLRLNN